MSASVELISSAHAAVDECVVLHSEIQCKVCSDFTFRWICNLHRIEASQADALTPTTKIVERVYYCDRCRKQNPTVVKRLDKFCSPTNSMHENSLNRCQGWFG